LPDYDPRRGHIGDVNGVLSGPEVATGGRGGPMTVAGKTMGDILRTGLAGNPNFLDLSDAKNPRLSDNARAAFDPVKLQAAYDAAGAAMAKTRDVNVAGRAFRDALGISSGDSFQDANWWASHAPAMLGGGGAGQIVPSASPAAPQAAPERAAAPASAASAPVSVKSEAEYNALAPNTSYVAPDGSVRTKGAARAAAPAQPQQAAVETEASHGGGGALIPSLFASGAAPAPSATRPATPRQRRLPTTFTNQQDAAFVIQNSRNPAEVENAKNFMRNLQGGA
jgi:hypothetical protein